MQSPVFYIIFGILGLAVIWIITYFIIRFMRGSIKLQLATTTFQPGDKINGKLDLTTKKNITGNRLFASLVGTKITKTHRDGKTHTNHTEIYRFETALEEAREFPAGYNNIYDFSLDVPAAGTGDIMNSKLGQTVGTALNLMGGTNSRIEWKITGRLDAKGIDLAATKKIMINL